MHEYVPDIDDNVPLPSKATSAMPELSPAEEVQMRARTIKLLAELGGDVIEPNQQEREAAADLAQKMISDPNLRPEYAIYPNETMAYLAGLVSQCNMALVSELSELKMYVVNKLIYEVEHSKDGKTRIAALSRLGEIDGVDAFKRRSEMTVTIKPIEEVERELLTLIENVDYHVIETPLVPQEATSVAGDATTDS